MGHVLTLLNSERLKLQRALAIPSAIRLKREYASQDAITLIEHEGKAKLKMAELFLLKIKHLPANTIPGPEVIKLLSYSTQLSMTL